jgi:hypothetical protein
MVIIMIAMMMMYKHRHTEGHKREGLLPRYCKGPTLGHNLQEFASSQPMASHLFPLQVSTDHARCTLKCIKWTLDHLLSQIRDSPNLEGQVPVFISPRNRVAQLYPQLLGSLFVASHDLQGYGPHRKRFFHYCVFSRCQRNVSTELFPSKGCSTVARLPSCYLATRLHVSNLGTM